MKNKNCSAGLRAGRSGF